MPICLYLREWVREMTEDDYADVVSSKAGENFWRNAFLWSVFVGPNVGFWIGYLMGRLW